VTTSAIEGEILDPEALRSSVAVRLGLPNAGLPEPNRASDGLIEILLDATRHHQEKLTEQRLFSWQAALFPTGYSGMRRIFVGGWRSDPVPMQIVSGPMGKKKIHFEAPPSARVAAEMQIFLDWWHNPPAELDGLVRAAIAHFWFVSIHPFEDGNGRIARALTEMALAQYESQSIRYYSLSAQLLKNKSQYHNLLEMHQKGSGEITVWLEWFLDIIRKSLGHSRILIQKSTMIAKFYLQNADIVLNERQNKVLKKLLECLPDELIGGLTNKKYCSMTKVSPETAKRDIKDLVDKGILVKNPGSGRSTSYKLKKSF
jgi:Fic family protein